MRWGENQNTLPIPEEKNNGPNRGGVILTGAERNAVFYLEGM
jgi:hypothetical protein